MHWVAHELLEVFVAAPHRKRICDRVAHFAPGVEPDRAGAYSPDAAQPPSMEPHRRQIPPAVIDEPGGADEDRTMAGRDRPPLPGTTNHPRLAHDLRRPATGGGSLARP